MQMLSEDDRDLHDLSDEELDLAWDFWFDLAQVTNDDDPAYSHGVFQRAAIQRGPLAAPGRADRDRFGV